jgi:exonuclease III
MPVINLKETYGSKYKVVDDGTNDSVRAERVWCQEILCECGVIYPYGHDGSLAARFDSTTMEKTRAWARKLKREGFLVIQRGDWEIVFKFTPEQIDYIAKLIKAKKKRHLSPKHRARASEFLKINGRQVRKHLPDFI